MPGRCFANITNIPIKIRKNEASALSFTLDPARSKILSISMNDVEERGERALRKREEGRNPAKRKRSPMLKPALFFGIAAAVLLGVVLAPSPNSAKKSGVEFYGEDMEVEIYGPELPQSTVGSYPVPVVESVVLPESTASAVETVYVYASDDQDCYHLPTCKFAYASGHKFTIAEARMLGYKPCGRCNPPLEQPTAEEE